MIIKSAAVLGCSSRGSTGQPTFPHLEEQTIQPDFHFKTGNFMEKPANQFSKRGWGAGLGGGAKLKWRGLGRGGWGEGL